MQCNPQDIFLTIHHDWCQFSSAILAFSGKMRGTILLAASRFPDHDRKRFFLWEFFISFVLTKRPVAYSWERGLIFESKYLGYSFAIYVHFVVFICQGESNYFLGILVFMYLLHILLFSYLHCSFSRFICQKKKKLYGNANLMRHSVLSYHIPICTTGKGKNRNPQFAFVCAKKERIQLSNHFCTW